MSSEGHDTDLIYYHCKIYSTKNKTGNIYKELGTHGTSSKKNRYFLTKRE